MLVLTLRSGESLHLSGPGEVKVLEVMGSGRKVRVGIEAPKTTNVDHVRLGRVPVPRDEQG